MDSIAIEVGAASISDEDYFQQTCQKNYGYKTTLYKRVTKYGISRIS